MKLLFIIGLLIPCQAYCSDLPLSDGDRIVIEGDSYADQKKWSCYLAAYWILTNPSLTLHVQEVGRSGTFTEQALNDPSGYHGYDEYEKLVYALQPDWVLTNYGDNGGDTTSQFMAATTDLHDNYVIIESAAVPIIVGPFPQLTSTGKPRNGDYENAEMTLCANRGWRFSAAWHYLLPIWTVSANWPILSTTLNSHVDTSGNIIEFYAIIRTLGFSNIVSNCAINAFDGTLTSYTNCAVTNITANTSGGIDFDRLDSKLPWVTDYDNDGYNKAVSLLPEIKNWQDYSVKITNLDSGTYNVLCDGTQIGSVSSNTLQSGWNMSDLHVGPVFSQVQEVLGKIRDMHGVDRVTLANVQKPDPFGHLPYGWRGVYKYKSNIIAYFPNTRGPALIASVQPALTELNNYDALIHSAAQPVTRHYSIRSTGASSSPTPTATIPPVPTPTATCICP